MVELDDIGLRVITRLSEADPHALHVGDPMRLVIEALAVDGCDDQTLQMWAFEVTA